MLDLEAVDRMKCAAYYAAPEPQNDSWGGLRFRLFWEDGGYVLRVIRSDDGYPSEEEMRQVRTAFRVPEDVRTQGLKHGPKRYAWFIWGSQNYEIERLQTGEARTGFVLGAE